MYKKAQDRAENIFKGVSCSNLNSERLNIKRIKCYVCF